MSLFNKMGWKFDGKWDVLEIAVDITVIVLLSAIMYLIVKVGL